jgi:hypothetical protein
MKADPLEDVLARDPGRQLLLLQALVRAEEGLRRDGRPTDFMLLQMPGPSFGFKPGVPGAEALQPMEGDIYDLEGAGYVRSMGSTSSSVVARLSLTPAGRAAGAPAPDSVRAMSGHVPPSPDDVLRWLAELSRSASGPAVLTSGRALLAEAERRFGHGMAEAIAYVLIGLGDDRLIDFDDPSRSLDQLTSDQRLANGGQFRLTSYGRDRADPPPQAPTSITQIVHAAQAQVAAGDINNYVTFTQLLDRVEEAIDEVDGVDDETREEAHSMVDKLRGTSTTVATGAASGGGGALLGAVLKKILGLE